MPLLSIMRSVYRSVKKKPERYWCVTEVRDQSKIKELSKLRLRAFSLSSTPEREGFLKERKAQYNAISSKKSSKGYQASLTQFLMTKYLQCTDNHKALFSLYYFLILDHIFSDWKHFNEQHFVGNIDYLNPKPSSYGSLLCKTSYEIECLKMMYDQIDTLLDPLLVITFRGIEYLGRLNSVDLTTSYAKKNFTLLMKEFSELCGEQIDALWEFRCATVHKGSLYNKNHKGEIYPFGTRWYPDQEFILKNEPRSHPAFPNGYWIVNGYGIYNLFKHIKQSLEEKMKTDFVAYALHADFAKWLRFNWTIQYLTTFDENKGSLDPSLKELLPNDFLSPENTGRDIEMATIEIGRKHLKEVMWPHSLVYLLDDGERKLFIPRPKKRADKTRSSDHPAVY